MIECRYCERDSTTEEVLLQNSVLEEKLPTQDQQFQFNSPDSRTMPGRMAMAVTFDIATLIPDMPQQTAQEAVPTCRLPLFSALQSPADRSDSTGIAVSLRPN